MSIKLYLDDTRPCPPGWTLVKWPDEAMPFLLAEQVSDLSLDHDLGNDNRGTGYTLIAWLEEQVAVNKLRPPAHISIHSGNPVGRTRMQAAIDGIKRTAKSYIESVEGSNKVEVASTLSSKIS